MCSYRHNTNQQTDLLTYNNSYFIWSSSSHYLHLTLTCRNHDSIHYITKRHLGLTSWTKERGTVQYRSSWFQNSTYISSSPLYFPFGQNHYFASTSNMFVGVISSTHILLTQLTQLIELQSSYNYRFFWSGTLDRPEPECDVACYLTLAWLHCCKPYCVGLLSHRDFITLLPRYFAV